jgi:D-lactate dehydrogenase
MSFKIIPVTIISNPSIDAKIAFFGAKKYDIETFEKANKKFNFEIKYFEDELNLKTVNLTKGFNVVCIFVNQKIDRQILENLRNFGVEVLLLRSAGFDNVDLQTAKDCRVTVLRVPEYSPQAIAEHAVGLLLSLVRKLNLSFERSKNYNFELEGLLGQNLFQKNIGVIGTGKIGKAFIKIAQGFGMNVLAYDIYPDYEASKKLGFRYVDLDYLYANSDIISLHSALTQDNLFMINDRSIQKMKQGVILINTSRGGLIKTEDLIKNLKSDKIGAAGLDVYENEQNYFFQNLENKNIQDENLVRLLSFKNVVVTPHQAFFTKESLDNIAFTSLSNVKAYFDGQKLINEISV